MSPLLSKTTGARAFGLMSIDRPMGGINLSGLHSWYDASDYLSFTNTANGISQWNDISGNGRHAVQANSSYRPTINYVTQNNKNVVTFNGSSQFLLAPASITSNALTFFSVYKRYSAGASGTYGRILSLYNTGNSNDYDNTNSLIVHTTAVSLGGVTPPLVGGYRASAPIAGSTISYGTSTSGASYLFSATLNGTSWSQNNSGTVVTGTTSATSLNSNSLNVGAGGPSGGVDQYFYGWFAEHIIFTRVLSNDEITAVRDYLSKKWNVT